MAVRFSILLFLRAMLCVLASMQFAHAEDALHRLRFGVAVGADEAIRERIEPFRLYLEEKLDVPVDLFLIDTLGELAEALMKGDVDYARLSPTAYAAASEDCTCIEPLASARPDSFPARFYSVLFARATEPRTTIADLKAKRLGVDGRDSVAGYRVPLTNLLAEGIDVRKHFRTLVRVQGPTEGLQAILDGRVEASLGWSTLAGKPETGYTAGTLNDFFLDSRSGFDKLQIVWRSPPIPYNAHSVRMDLPDDTKRVLRGALLDLRDEDPSAYFAIEPDFPGGLEPVVHGDYRAVLRSYDPGFQEVLEAGN